MDAFSNCIGLIMPAAVASSPIVEDLEVVEDRVGRLHAGLPAVPVKQFHLHPRPERLDHRGRRDDPPRLAVGPFSAKAARHQPTWPGGLL